MLSSARVCVSRVAQMTIYGMFVTPALMDLQ